MIDCPVCRAVEERSALYERWLLAENYADGASLQAIAAARGFCTIHARRLLERDTDIAGPVASFVLQMIAAHVKSRQRDRREHVDALEPSRLCPWCATEREALEYALAERKRKASELCAPHARASLVAARQTLHVISPLLPGPSLVPPPAGGAVADPTPWWSNAVSTLWEAMGRTCAACEAAWDAGERREAFLREGPRPHEHWEVPTLCVAHDRALGNPTDPAYVRAPDHIERACDWCAVMYRAATRAAQLFAVAFGDPRFRLSYASISGLCLPHCSAAMQVLHETARGDFAAAIRVRVDAMVWELEERAMRRSWQLRDQRTLPNADTLSHRAWWLISGGVFRAERTRTP